MALSKGTALSQVSRASHLGSAVLHDPIFHASFARDVLARAEERRWWHLVPKINTGHQTLGYSQGQMTSKNNSVRRRMPRDESRSKKQPAPAFRVRVLGDQPGARHVPRITLKGPKCTQ